MALFVRQDENRTEYQKKIAMELQERSRQQDKYGNLPDGVEDSQYIKGTKSTTSLAWIWILIVIVSVGIAIWLMMLDIAKI